MSGRRAKALRRQFKRDYGREPRGAGMIRLRRSWNVLRNLGFWSWVFAPDAKAPSEWRAYKRVWRTGVA